MIHALTAAGSHTGRGLDAARQRGDGVVALGLMWHATGVQQTHHLFGGKAKKREEYVLDYILQSSIVSNTNNNFYLFSQVDIINAIVIRREKSS